MAYACKVIADSVSFAGCRLTTFEITYPRFVHSELLTHRMLSRNSASSRAIPAAKLIERVKTDPVTPVWWGKNEPGMQARAELEGEPREQAELLWLAARDEAVLRAEALAASGLHKQIVNRILEPWMWITVLVSATDLDNFFALRCHPDAQPEIKTIADMMLRAYRASEGTTLALADWHMPLVSHDERAALLAEGFSARDVRFISAGRCARVSTLTHDGKRDPRADVALAERLGSSGHLSPFEHVAESLGVADYVGNFRGWRQLRKTFEHEANFAHYSPISVL